ncbi:unnamed protein product [Thelazia callipaeda]|uniref:CN hydrolase domain-containing protein n=1 Tax=Thelazia callipaeda TaxID=103827 RepID=A0A0N5CZX4_THECL|nr:unnamed protein product [Thelazia callipaeda]
MSVFGPDLREIAHSSISTMPVFGPDGRVLQKGATVTNSSPPNSTLKSIGQLGKRYGRSCDFLEKRRTEDFRSFDNNPIAQVGSIFMFKKLQQTE